ncbi:uncharacterized protein LOC113382837 isoform X2 [Ctenocephalides felis]|nr:uncharacterized protein LOC113382837 isoform X2 [Ctenocephalides felis]
MHIKHYHPNLQQYFGSTPNVADLAYARTIRETPENEPVAKNRYSNTQFYEKVSKIDNIYKRGKASPIENEVPIKDIKLEKDDDDYKDITHDTKINTDLVKKEQVDEDQTNNSVIKTETSMSCSESPLLEEALRVDNKNKIKHHVTFENESPLSRRYKEPPEVQKIPGGGIKRLLPKKREETTTNEVLQEKSDPESDQINSDFTRIDKKLGLNQKRQRVETSAGLIQKLLKRSQNKQLMKKSGRPMIKEEHDTIDPVHVKNEEEQRRSSMSTDISKAPIENTLNNTSDTNKAVEAADPALEVPKVYINEDGEEIKLVRMRREEIINCICGHREEDGLMVQCELCLCWQHALCHGIQRERDVPDKYVCAICTNPQKPRQSRKYIHDQEWLLEGRLPHFITEDLNLKTSAQKQNITNLQEFTKCVHETTGNALELMPVLKSLRAKLSMAMQTHHPKFYYWAKPWGKYSDMNNDTMDANQDQSPTNNSRFKDDNEISPTLQALQRDLCNAVNESELLGARIENEMNLLKSKNMNKPGTNDVDMLSSHTRLNPANNTILTPTGNNTLMNTETPSRGLNLDSESKDDFAALAKSDVLDLSAILESNHVIPTDSELVSILEGDMKTENDLNSPMRGNKQDEDCKINMDLLSFMSSDDTKLMDSGKSAASIKSTSSGDLTDSQNLLAPLLASPGGTKFDLVSDRELENFAQTVGQEVLITNTAPVPEEAIDNEQCRWNLLRHISDYQAELEKRIDQFNIKLSVLLASPEAPPPDALKLDQDCTRLMKMMQRDLRTLGDTCSVISTESRESENNKVSQSQEQNFLNCSVAPTDVKRLW